MSLKEFVFYLLINLFVGEKNKMEKQGCSIQQRSFSDNFLKRFHETTPYTILKLTSAKKNNP